jgi:uncharacterized protein (UPF0335 family)
MRREGAHVGERSREGEALELRLAALEGAYRSLLERVQRYERERAQIRARLEGILASIASNRSTIP